MGFDERFNSLIAKIYNAGGNPAKWQDVLIDLQKVLGCQTIMMGVSSPNPMEHSFSLDYSLNFDPDFKLSYDEYFFQTNYLLIESIKRKSLVAGKILNIQDLIQDGRFEESEFYNDWLKPQGLYYASSCVLNFGKDYQGLFTVNRNSKEGPFSKNDLRMLKMIAVHLQNSVFQARYIGESISSLMEYERALEVFPAGIALINEKGEVIFKNRETERIIAQADGLNMDSAGRFKCNDRAKERQLGRLIFKTVRETKKVGDTKEVLIHIDRPSGRKPYTAWVSKVSWHELPFDVRQGRAIIVIDDPHRELEKIIDRLIKLYGLTPAEAKLTSLLVSGYTLERATEILGVSKNTTRTQLRNACQKTNTSSQVELVALTAGNPIIKK